MQHRTMWTAVVAVVVVAILALGVYAWTQNNSEQAKNTETAVKNQDSEQEKAGQDELTTRQYRSANGVVIEIDNWADNRKISSPLTITGQVPGNWSYEGIFPVEILHEGDIGLPGATAELQGDWMTDDLVPFTATLSFDESQLTDGETTIILHNANPSGSPENSDSLALKVRVVKQASIDEK